MKNTGMGNQVRAKKDHNQEETVEVLYQKMGDRWFAFSLIDDEVFVGSISQGEVDHPQAEEVKFKEIVGRS